jgi:AraC-like DNA-binding protein
MNINLTSKWGALPLTNKYPTPPAGLLFPGAKLQVARDRRKDYCYLFQQFKTRYFTIRYCCFYSAENDVLVVTNPPGVTFRLGISHSHQVMTKDLGNQVFHERGYNLFCNASQSAEYSLRSGETFIFLDLLPERDYLCYLKAYFQETETFIRKASKGRAGKLTQCNQVAITEIWRWQEDLMDWCYNARRRRSDGDVICNKLVVAGIRSARPAPEKRGIPFTLQEMNNIANAAEIIRDADEMPSIELLSASMGISAYKFNAGFKKIFGHTASKHKFEDKMSYALRLMDCKKASLTLVATELGYNQPEAFSLAFIKRFGYAPFENDKPA